MYLIQPEDKESKINFYNEVLPVNSAEGEFVQFHSPFTNEAYRKVLYLIKNKKKLEGKQAIILPFLNDNFISFNRRETITQFNNFLVYQN